ncbi:hypothetical protein [Haladaptatus sp. ZSTT2]|uniref:hypothetical protein n=1 Tax=Haladaptatus sp. ZSTT2 TaxID=3120515 RepID=UPI00300EB353
MSNNATPPKGHDWGERTQQSVSHTAPKYWKTDAYEIRQRYGIPPLDISAFDAKNRQDGQITSDVYPDMVVHERNPTLTRSPKGTDCFFLGERGCGKTTLAGNLVVRVMDDRVVVDGEEVEVEPNDALWRGSSRRSGWLPFRNWTTLWLPTHASVEAAWMREDDDPGDEPMDVVENVADVVRDVVFYDDVLDLVSKLGERTPGSFHVIYPDPSFSGCEELTAESDRVAGSLPFVPRWEADEQTPATPVVDWWFAFMLARVEHGPFRFQSLFFDEIGDWVPERAKNEKGRRLYDKIGLLRGIWADSRRALLSIYNFGHYEENVHNDIRREHKWRVQMPDGTPNPTKVPRSTVPVGFKTVPMHSDIMSRRSIGEGLCYTQAQMSLFGWGDIPGLD